MYPNLVEEMSRKNITKADIAKALNRRYATIIDKSNGKYGFSLEEALLIKNLFFPNLTVEYLFEKEEREVSM